jgi:predicted extracellular nuclease
MRLSFGWIPVSLLWLAACGGTASDSDLSGDTDATDTEESEDSDQDSGDDSSDTEDDTSEDDDTSDSEDSGDDSPAEGALFISELVDHPLDGAIKYIEIANTTAASIDLTDYEIAMFKNGGSTADRIELTGSVAAGAVYVLAGGASDTKAKFEARFPGKVANMYAQSFNVNGDDAVVLRPKNSSDVTDIFGAIGVDANADGAPPAAWFYENSVAQREGRNANTTWTSSEWEITGEGSDSGASAAAKCTPGEL